MCAWGIWWIARVTIHATDHAHPNFHRQQQAQGCVSFQLKNFSLCATLSCGFLQLPSASFLRLPVVFGILRRRHWINVNPCYPSFYVAAACIFICIPHSLSLFLSALPPAALRHFVVYVRLLSLISCGAPNPPLPLPVATSVSTRSFLCFSPVCCLYLCVCVSFTVSFVLFCNYGHVCAAKFYVHARCKPQFKARQIVRATEREGEWERGETDALIATCTTFAQWHPSVLYGATIYG